MFNNIIQQISIIDNNYESMEPLWPGLVQVTQRRTQVTQHDGTGRLGVEP